MRVCAVFALVLATVQLHGSSAAESLSPTAVAPGTITVAADGIDERTGLPRLVVSASAPSEPGSFAARRQPFCFDGFRMSAARALCRGQGFRRGAVLESEPLGSGWQPLNVWVDCGANATSLDHQNCTFITRSNATCDARANVICNVRDLFTIENCANGTAPPTCAYGGLQMRPGDERQPHPPHVDAVCADHLESRYNVARTACRALGLLTNDAYIWGRRIADPKDTVVWPDGISCGPHGSDLLFGCRMWTYRFRSPTCLTFAVLNCEWWHGWGDPDEDVWVVPFVLTVLGFFVFLWGLWRFHECYVHVRRRIQRAANEQQLIDRDVFARHADEDEPADETTAAEDDLLGVPLQPGEAARPANPLVPVEL